MRRRRTFILLSAVIATLAAAMVLLLYLRSRGAPQAARLLPESEAVVFADLGLLRFAQSLGRQDLVISNEPEYQEFVRQTGFHFERDLSSAAFAVHSVLLPQTPPRRGQAAAPGQRVTRFSEIFIGNFDSSKVSAYLRKLAASTESHHDAEIFVIPHQGRTVRVSILSVDTVAASNHEDAQIIRGMIDRFRAAAAPHSGPQLVRDYYEHVPFGSLVWAVARTAGGTRSGFPVAPAMAPVLQNVTIVGSARFTGSLHLRAEAFAANAGQAQQIVELASTFLSIFKGSEGASTPSGMDQDVKAFFESFEVKQEDTRAVLTATAGLGFLQKLVQTPAPPQAPAAVPEQ